MINPALRPDASLPEILMARARSASDGRLVADVIGGFLLATLAAVFRFHGWPVVLSAGICFAAFGAWGIADREVRERASGPRTRLVGALEYLRVLSAVLGGLAALAMIFGALGLALGTWIS